VTPHVLKAVDKGDGWEPAHKPEGQGEAGIKPETMAAIDDGMWMVVNAAGTGGNARMVGYDVSGKTGTVQVISLEGARALKGRTDLDLRDHGWFVFLAPRPAPEIAGAVFVEHGEHGTVGALIARHVLETYYAKKEGRPMPVFKPPPHAISKRPVGSLPAVVAATTGVQGAGQ